MAVISLCKSIKNASKTHVTFDNFYTGIPLITYLKDYMHLHSVGTIKRNRTMHCPLTDGKEFLKKERGSYESRVSKNAVVVVQWADKPVCLASSFVGVEPVGTIKRYSKDAHGKIDVPCPRAVSVYNETMGGVDLADMYMALYKIPTRAKRYYFPFIGYSLEVALTNSWLQYKRDCNLLQVPKKEVIPNSKKFRLEVSEGLRVLLLKKRGQPSLDSSLSKKMIKRCATTKQCY
ncbi:piggyBac transposable element-derived protein 2-like [Frankliniella occidentalis]|uniref:PiggyBac transposable element-derived protein 2-like n=1 Tax=Frankliniella occidentalis TaxID=133901 RepID=A0A9C6X6T0_FRAOC|nr:piggyBac transposable element-derived protein 2-like [Frankliniella occidentalis]